MGEDENRQTEYIKGLFGETDRNNGEYRFRSGETERIYADARYTPLGEEAVPPRYYKPESAKPRSKTPVKKKRRGVASVIIICLCCAVLGGLLGAGLVGGYYGKRLSELEASVENLTSTETVRFQQAESEQTEDLAIPAESLSSTELSSSDIYNLACQQVVSITTEYSVGTPGYGNMPGIVTGSGFLLSEDGYIMTNFHVVERAYYGGYSVNVTFTDGSAYNGVVTSVKADNDLAIVKIEAQGLQPAVLGTDQDIQGGADITIAGNPYGMFTVSSGKISNPSVDVDVDDSGSKTHMFQLDVSVYEGNSGGPVYDRQGHVIGIVTAKVSVDSSDGIGFAIPVSEAEKLYENLDRSAVKTSVATLSVEFYKDYDQMFQAYYSYPAGAFIDKVYSGGCAERAGLTVGDVIMQLGDYGVSNYTDVDAILSRYRAGDQINVLFYRNSQLMLGQVILDEKAG